MKRVDHSLNYLRSLLLLSEEDIALKRFDTELFEAEVRLLPIEKEYVKAIIRVKPKIVIPREVLGSIYYSELFVQTEDAIINAIRENHAQKMISSDVIHISQILNKKIIGLELKRVLLKIKRAMEAFSNADRQKEIRKILSELSKYKSDIEKNKKNIIIATMKLNEILFYGE